MIMKYISFFLLTILLQGCISTTVPAKSEYRINPNIQPQELEASGCKENSLKISQAFSANSLLSQDMYYALGNTKQYMYSASKWSTTPNRAITSEFLTLIRDSKLFKNVQTSKSRSRSDVILEINIEDFMQYFDENSTSSYANVVINVSLIRARGNSVFASQTFKTKINIEALDASGGVDGLNIALSEVLLDTNKWLAEVCK